MVQTRTLRLIFIVGVGRSGTSLLQSMLAAHPMMAGLPETSFLRRYAAKGVLQFLNRTGHYRSVVSQLESDPIFSRTALSAEMLTVKALHGAGQLDIRLYRAMLEAAAPDQYGYVLDKDPRMIEFLPLLKSAVPDAQVVNIIRDPRDVLVSKKQAAWSRHGHVWKHIFANRLQLQLGREDGERLFGSLYHEVIYERLISSPVDALMALCDKLGVPYDPAMMQFNKAAEGLVSPSEMSWKKETLGPLLYSNTNKWRTNLHCREIRLTEECCEEAMRAGGYAADQSCARLSLFDRLWVLAGRLVISAWTTPYRLYRKHSLRAACG